MPEELYQQWQTEVLNECYRVLKRRWFECGITIKTELGMEYKLRLMNGF